MELLKKNKNVLFLTRNGGMLYSSDLLEPISINFPEDIINNLEIVDEDRLKAIVRSKVKEVPVKSKEVLIVLDKNVIFEKDIDKDSIVEQNKEVEAFLDIIPFEKIINKVYRIKDTVKVIASNQEYLDAVVDALKSEDLSPISVIPISMIDMEFPSPKKDFDFNMDLEKIEKASKYSILDLSENEEKVISYEKPNIRSPHFVVLISIFAVLVIILLVLVYSQIIAPKNAKPSSGTSSHQSAKPSIEATPSATLEPDNSK